MSSFLCQHSYASRTIVALLNFIIMTNLDLMKLQDQYLRGGNDNLDIFECFFISLQWLDTSELSPPTWTPTPYATLLSLLVVVFSFQNTNSTFGAVSRKCCRNKPTEGSCQAGGVRDLPHNFSLTLRNLSGSFPQCFHIPSQKYPTSQCHTESIQKRQIEQKQRDSSHVLCLKEAKGLTTADCNRFSLVENIRTNPLARSAFELFNFSVEKKSHLMDFTFRSRKVLIWAHV